MKLKQFAMIVLTSMLLALIFGGIMVFAPPSNITNPALGNVFITNTSDDPVPVEITATQFQPVQFLTVFSIPEGSMGNGDTEAFEVPAGKLLVIEYVSGHVFGVPSDNSLDLVIETRVGNGLVQNHHLGLAEPQGRYEQYLSKMVKLYASPETFVGVYGEKYTDSGFMQLFFTISGYLVDVS